MAVQTCNSTGDENVPLLSPAAKSQETRSIRHLWQMLVFGWFSPVVELIKLQLDQGISPDLEDENIPPLQKDDTRDGALQEFNRAWRKERELKADCPSLARCLWNAFSPLFLQAGVLKLLHDCLQFVGPLVLNGLIKFLRKPSDNLHEGLMLTAAVTIAQLGMSFCLRHYFFMCYRVSLRIRTSVLLAIYEKALTIDSSYYQDHPIGQVTNLMSVDTQRIQDVVSFLHAIWYSFLQMTLAIYFLWQQLGPSCLAGVLVIILSIPVTAVTASWMGRLQKKVMKCKDDRIQTNQETITNMKVVKLQAWEVPFRKKVMELRRLEIRQFLVYCLSRGCTNLLWSAVPLLIALGTFAAYVVLAGQILDVASALTALALFEMLRFPLFMLPNVINMLVEANVAIKRIEEFLNAPDCSPPQLLKDDTKVIQIKDGTFSYRNFATKENKKSSLKDQLDQTEKDLLLIKAILADAEDQLAQLEGRQCCKSYGSSVDTDDEADALAEKLLSLKRLNFECSEGEFIAVVGGVGSGKSTLLKAILGEVCAISGEARVRGKVAYFDQKPFILNDTVRGNILFGKATYNEELYRLAIQTSCLNHDLAMLPKGDQCEIGERGITLSGGQKARISMARAVYHNPDIALLDDCLSAVDAHVGQDLFNQCIVNTLLRPQKVGHETKKRTVVLVTNALQYLSHPSVDRIVVLKNGLVVESGAYKELVSREGSHFQIFLKAFSNTMSDSHETEDKYIQDNGMTFGQLKRGESFFSEHAMSEASCLGSSMRDLQDPDVDKPVHSLISDEMAEREIGKVGQHVYRTWADSAGGLQVIPFILLVFIVGECTTILSNWWLTYWSNSAGHDMPSQLRFLGIYGIINVSAIIAEFLRTVIIVLLGLRASRKLFGSLLDSIMDAPMAFFDTTPSGRIMNRFSKDIYTVDEDLPASFQMYTNCLFMTASTLVVVTTVTPTFAWALLPIIYLYRRQHAYFSQCYSELKRIDSVKRSPIYTLFGETLDGPATIRAFEAQKSLFDRMGSLVDTQQHAFYLTQAGLSWLAIRVELIGTTIVMGSCLAAVYEKRNFLQGDEVFAGLAGLSISYALAVTQALNWAVRVGSDFEANMVAVERIAQYCNLNREGARVKAVDQTLDSAWPLEGTIEFKQSRLRYRPGLPLVLKGLDLKIPARSKVGIVGRTGAGKSTLMTALMRLVELDGGSIFIDGIDTHEMGLQRLRSSIAVIPQDPVLFSGSVRTNLDPFSVHQDKDLIDVLRRVGLWTSEKFSCIKSLQQDVLQDGENFSVGQRQLLVIARALLDGAGIVVCDEATSAIDAAADARVQKVLRTDFENATTLTIAHRLNTIMDSTHILVMSDGKCAEFDTPANLLAKGGLFKDLVDKWEEHHDGDP